MTEKEIIRNRETPAWRAYTRYRDKYLAKTNAVTVMKQCRRFYQGNQYDEDELDPSIPKPVLNICFQYVEMVKAKITEAQYSVQFTSQDDTRNLKLLDQFYDYQKAEMNDVDTNASLVERALIDGVGCAFTIYDADTRGVKGKYRGYLRRKIVDFEDVFFANPYCEDPQDQKYLGFVQRISVKEARDLCEGKNEKKFIVPDNWDLHEDYDEDDADFDTCTLVTRYFRDESGEVCFEQCTKYARLFRKPHHLHPGLDSFDDTANEEGTDYENMDEEHTPIQLGAMPIGESEYEARLKVFWRYPFAWYRPYPVRNQVLGNSVLTQLMTNQKMVNFVFMLAMLDFQNHGMAKWLVQDGALADGETINNDPGQIIRVKNKLGTSVANAVQRIEPSSSSAEQLQLPNVIITIAKQIYGFDNLTGDNNLNDTSGYALQQVQKQQDLPLEIPQQRYWDYVKQTAKTDLLFFRDYVDEAMFFTQRSAGEVQQANAYRDLAQNVYDANNVTAPGADPSTGMLPDTQERIGHKITSQDFMKDFEICVEVVQGIAQNRISESQHVNQIYQYLMSGNVDAGLMKALITADPAISRKTREDITASLDSYENSQIFALNAQIDQYKQVITDLQQKIQTINQQVNYQNLRLDAYKKATEENANQNKAVMDAYTQKMKATVENQGEVKSNNARGIANTSFDDDPTE